MASYFIGGIPHFQTFAVIRMGPSVAGCPVSFPEWKTSREYTRNFGAFFGAAATVGKGIVDRVPLQKTTDVVNVTKQNIGFVWK